MQIDGAQHHHAVHEWPMVFCICTGRTKRNGFSTIFNAFSQYQFPRQARVDLLFFKIGQHVLNQNKNIYAEEHPAPIETNQAGNAQNSIPQTEIADFARPEDILVARNLRRLEIHRWEMNRTLQQINTEDYPLLQDEISEPNSQYLASDEMASMSGSSAIPHEMTDTEQNVTIIPVPMPSVSETKVQRLKHQILGQISKHIDLSSWQYMKNNMLLSFHSSFYDRAIENRLFAPFSKYKRRQRPNSLREREAKVPCAPTKLVEWTLEILSAYRQGGSFKDFVFIDPASGHGRSLLMASHFDFRQIIGFELDRQNFDDSRMNIAQYSRSFMKQRDVQVIREDVRLAMLPERPLVVHIFDPQSEVWLKAFLEQLERCYYQTPRPIYIILIGNTYANAMANCKFVSSLPPPASSFDKLMLFSPYNIQFYATYELHSPDIRARH